MEQLISTVNNESSLTKSNETKFISYWKFSVLFNYPAVITQEKKWENTEKNARHKRW